MAQTNYITLNNGVQMPVIGYGTYQTPPNITERCVSDALRIGYRSVDTAQCYGNEREVGFACRKSGIQRTELFITTKLWGCHKYSDTLRSIDSSLRRLNLEYIDLLLIHEPTGNVHEIYRAMETPIGMENYAPLASQIFCRSGIWIWSIIAKSSPQSIKWKPMYSASKRNCGSWNVRSGPSTKAGRRWPVGKTVFSRTRNFHGLRITTV